VRPAASVADEAPAAGRTTLLITHDLDGLDQVDEIVVPRHGKVVKRGS
jgi:ATP-binding cassette subfamily C protein CydC